jgi:hypothetical protein
MKAASRKAACRSKSDSVVHYLKQVESSCDSNETSLAGRRNLRWSMTVPTILIPTKEEFKEVGCDIWWHYGDILLFKREAKEEITRATSDLNLSWNDAKALLYQPSTATNAP